MQNYRIIQVQKILTGINPIELMYVTIQSKIT